MGFPGMVVNQTGPGSIQEYLFVVASRAGQRKASDILGDWRQAGRYVRADRAGLQVFKNCWMLAGCDGSAFLAIALSELVHLSGSIHDLLLACEERVTL